MYKYQSSIWRRELNLQTFKHESSPITTKPGLPPSTVFLSLSLFPSLTIALFLNAFLYIFLTIPFLLFLYYISIWRFLSVSLFSLNALS